MDESGRLRRQEPARAGAALSPNESIQRSAEQAQPTEHS